MSLNIHNITQTITQTIRNTADAIKGFFLGKAVENKTNIEEHPVDLSAQKNPDSSDTTQSSLENKKVEDKTETVVEHKFLNNGPKKGIREARETVNGKDKPIVEVEKEIQLNQYDKAKFRGMKYDLTDEQVDKINHNKVLKEVWGKGEVTKQEVALVKLLGKLMGSGSLNVDAFSKKTKNHIEKNNQPLSEQEKALIDTILQSSQELNSLDSVSENSVKYADLSKAEQRFLDDLRDNKLDEKTTQLLTQLGIKVEDFQIKSF